MSVITLHQALSDFNNADAFFAHLSDNVVVEFPYGPTLGLPSHVTGKGAVQAHLSAVQAGGLKVSTPEIQQITDERYLVEYTGTYHGLNGARADVPLIAIITCDGPLITNIREYWDTHQLVNLNAG